MQGIVLTSIKALRALGSDEIDAMCRAAAKAQQNAKSATETHRSNSPATGKVICVLEERMEAAKAANLLAKNTSLKSYWESITKSQIPNHALSCATTFGLVRVELLPESDYDVCSANCLEIAGAIINAIAGDMTHAEVKNVVHELKQRGKDAPKTLRTILARVKPPKAMESTEAAELLRRICKDGHLNVAIHAVGAEIVHLQGDKAKDAYHNFVAAGVLVDRHFGKETTDKWLAEINAGANSQPANSAPALTPSSTPPASEGQQTPEKPATETPDANKAPEPQVGKKGKGNKTPVAT